VTASSNTAHDTKLTSQYVVCQVQFDQV
jgi:hypothetical protein